MTSLSESTVESAALAWLRKLGWNVAHGPNIAPDTVGSERDDYAGVVLRPRLHAALTHLNLDLPPEVLADASRKLTRPGDSQPRLPPDVGGGRDSGIPLCGRHGTRSPGPVDFENPANNDWLAVNQFTVTEHKNTRRPDILQFVNGLPLGVIELKNPTDEDATIWTAWQQLQTYKSELSTLFSMNEILMVSDGIEARIGSLTAGREWFKPWRTISGESLADPHMTELQVMLEGTCTHHRFLSLVRDFIVFEEDGSGALVKNMAGYHQFHAVQVAVTETPRQTWRPAHRCGLEHPGLGQEPDHGLLCRDHHPRAGHGEPHDHRLDRP